jgi:hypothetical protein
LEDANTVRVGEEGVRRARERVGAAGGCSGAVSVVLGRLFDCGHACRGGDVCSVASLAKP